MKGIPDESRDTTGRGRATDPTRNNLNLGRAGCVSRYSSSERKYLSDNAIRLVSCGTGHQERQVSFKDLPDSGSVGVSYDTLPVAVARRWERARSDWFTSSTSRTGAVGEGGESIA